MIRVYFLKSKRVDNIDTLDGIEYIHNAILTVEDSIRKLIQDTTDTEHNGLLAAAVSWREATKAEISSLEALPKPPPLDPDIAKIDNLLASLTANFTTPELLKLLQIFTKKLR